jgi:hypothetical protein
MNLEKAALNHAETTQKQMLACASFARRASRSAYGEALAVGFFRAAVARNIG